MSQLGFDLRNEASLKMLTHDVLSSSSIEGEIFNPVEVRSSIARRLNLDIAGMIPSNHYVDGVVEMMLEATQNYKGPITAQRLFGWHSALFPTGRSGIQSISVGQWRSAESGPMQVISGPIGKEIINYEAPRADTIDQEMNLFFTWCKTDQNIDPVLKAGIAHLWFVTIHPFEDGNGRIARAIGDLFLARSDKSQERFYSLSRQIETDRKSYYEILERQQRGSVDITLWLEWFLNSLNLALSHSEKSLDSIMFKSQLWERLNTQGVNDRQRLIINRILEENFIGFMNTSKYAKIAKCSNDTALRDIQDLKTRNIFIQNPGKGRSTSYRLTKTVI
jgi:Fic family protein